MDGPPELPETELSRRVAAAANGRKVMIFIGAGNRIKGFDAFAAEALAQRDSVLSVVAGRVAPEKADEAQRLAAAGMIVEDRFVTDDEILSLYRVASFAWCRYAPEYDQASGVFGRALQTGVQPMVRESSVLERLEDWLRSGDAYKKNTSSNPRTEQSIPNSKQIELRTLSMLSRSLSVISEGSK